MHTLTASPLRTHVAPRRAACCNAIFTRRVSLLPRAGLSTPPELVQQQGSAPTVSLQLRRPVGIVFSQQPGGPVYVEEVTPGSNAAKTGAVVPGDVLTSCSAVVLKAGKEGQYEAEGYGQRPYDNWERVMLDCEGREFKTVMSALKSNNERWGIMDVTLVFRKPADDAEAALCVSPPPPPPPAAVLPTQ